jgi:hypothetical protein
MKGVLKDLSREKPHFSKISDMGATVAVECAGYSIYIDM